ncbi:MAG: hypothetical protein LC746_06105 [Acidobacteria bacterium]|nr:hypothetical protein [Acidobacteriota bacterium]
MSTNEIAASKTNAPPVAKEAPTEQQASQAGAPKRFAKGQTVCNEKNEKGKLCNGHLKQVTPVGEDALVHLRGEDVLYKCQTCGALYAGPPLGHLRDPRKQSRFVERELVEILEAAGGTLPAIKKNERGVYVLASEAGHGHAPAKPAATGATPAAAPKATAPAPAAKPAEPEETPEQKRERKKAEAAARRASAVPIPGASGPPPGVAETPEQKAARLKAVVEEAKRRKAAAATEAAVPSDIPPSVAPPPAPTSGTDSSPAADAHRPAAEAQAATGAASAAPLSPAAATASPAAGAETVADLGTDASTELTPGAPPAGAKAKGSHTGFKPPAELATAPPGETPEEKIARLKRLVEEAKRAAGKL